MKLDIARGVFLIGALGVASLAAAAWHEPGPVVLHSELTAKQCSMPLNTKSKVSASVRPDQDLLLLVFGLAQGGTR
jgi:hypothetical protein